MNTLPPNGVGKTRLHNTHRAPMLKTGSSIPLVLILQTLMSKWAQPTTSGEKGEGST